MTKDPFCGMELDEKEAVATAVYNGNTYYFCSSACKEHFEKEPENYVEN